MSAKLSEKPHHHPGRGRVIQVVYTLQACNMKSIINNIFYKATGKDFESQKLSEQIAGIFKHNMELCSFHPGKDNYRHLLN